MNKNIKKVFSLRAVRKFFSSVSSLSFNMVRYFPNTFEDYKSGTVLALDKDEVTLQIDANISGILQRLPPSHKAVDGGLYVGVTGIAYMFYHLSKNPLLQEKKLMFLTKGREYIQPALETSTGDKTSFLLGDAGTYAIAAVISKALDDNKFADYLKKYKSLHELYLNPKFLKCGGDEYFVGRAGYLAGALWLARELQLRVLTNDELYTICDVIVASGREFAAKQRSPCPLMYHYYNTQYLGAAHGVSFILEMLISVPGYLKHNLAAAEDVKNTTSFIASLQTKEGNWPCCMEEIGQLNNENKLVHWCHGAPGTVYLMAKAYQVFKDQKYYDACVQAGEVVWNKGLLRKGPGICHGIAGNAYVFLLLYRLTGDEKYLHRAKVFADFMVTDDFLREARVPDNPESLYEGTAGTVCFLSDLLVPDKAEFPFQDVFTI